MGKGRKLEKLLSWLDRGERGELFLGGFKVSHLAPSKANTANKGGEEEGTKLLTLIEMGAKNHETCLMP